jgi:protein-S-isoprenylcysteine O-methyltransferase Ste14
MLLAGTLPRVYPRIRLIFHRGNILPAVAWAIFITLQVAQMQWPPYLLSLELLAINTVTIGLIILRRPATKTGSLAEGVLAVAGTFIIALLAPPNHPQDTFPRIVEIAGVSGWAVSLFYLGRSFGIVPADRGLVVRGPYRFIRHPIYAFEMVFIFGYFLAVPTFWSGAVIAAWVVLQLFRIAREERILGGYDVYAQHTRWRLVPGIW